MIQKAVLCGGYEFIFGQVVDGTGGRDGDCWVPDLTQIELARWNRVPPVVNSLGRQRIAWAQLHTAKSEDRHQMLLLERC